MSNRRRILIFTGDGKGKTTAALGMALRACGHGMDVCMIQFVKADGRAGEVLAAKNLPGLEIVQTGLGFLPPPGDPQLAEHKAAAHGALDRAAKAIASGRYPLVILDEVCFAVSGGLLESREVISAIEKAPADACIVMTGRGATPELVAIADTVTEMRCVKHGMDRGLGARKGVEF